jgi:putative ABC transport system permease protein
LLITSFVRLSQQNIGYRYENLWIGFVTLPQARYPDLGSRQRFAEQTLAALRNTPGIESGTMCADIPLLPAGISNTLYTRPDGEILSIDKRAAAVFHNIAADYLKTFGIPLLAGRDFNEHDVADGQNVILISQSGAKKVFGSENPIGKTLPSAVTARRPNRWHRRRRADAKDCRARRRGTLPALGAAKLFVPQH